MLVVLLTHMLTRDESFVVVFTHILIVALVGGQCSTHTCTCQSFYLLALLLTSPFSAWGRGGGVTPLCCQAHTHLARNHMYGQQLLGSNSSAARIILGACGRSRV